MSKPEGFTANSGCNYTKKCTIEDEGDCRVTRGVYEVSCQTCLKEPNPKKSLCVGTSGHTIHKRNLEHLGALNRRQRSNAIARHSIDKHPTTAPDFKTRSLKGHVRFNLDRYILEGLTIEKYAGDETVHLLIERGEWGRSIPRLVNARDRL